MSLAAPAPPPDRRRVAGHDVPAGGAAGARYAVVDVETTGLDARVARIVEVAVVECAADGTVVDDWSSLVAVPGEGALGASFIHGITRSMLEQAPAFADLVPELVGRLAGRVVVGHVLAFDLGHLGAEFRRVGAELPDLAASSLCTRELARAHLPPGPRSLAHCCAAAGVPIVGAHTALGDARAAAGLLRAFVERGCSPGWAARDEAARRLVWPAVATGFGDRSRSLARPRPTPAGC